MIVFCGDPTRPTFNPGAWRPVLKLCDARAITCEADGLGPGGGGEEAEDDGEDGGVESAGGAVSEAEEDNGGDGAEDRGAGQDNDTDCAQAGDVGDKVRGVFQ